MRRVIVIGVIMVAVLTSAVVNARKQYIIYGAGVQSCGKWLENRRKTDNTDWLLQGQWTMGWLSSAGYYGTKMKDSDSAAVSAWLDNYCKANPLDDLSEAARGLVEALRAK